MYGAILEKGEEYYTFLEGIFSSINGEQNNYNWLLTDVFANPSNQIITDLLSKDFCWISGEKLTEIIAKENFQWIWGVLSGFEKSIDRDQVLKYPLPLADGYEGFWNNPVSLQHPLATIEIVAFDSSLTLIMSKNQELIDNFRESFPLSENLEVYNES